MDCISVGCVISMVPSIFSCMCTPRKSDTVSLLMIENFDDISAIAMSISLAFGPVIIVSSV
jgi:hypothetical protein